MILAKGLGINRKKKKDNWYSQNIVFTRIPKMLHKNVWKKDYFENRVNFKLVLDLT